MWSDFMIRVSMFFMAVAFFANNVTLIQRNVVLAICFMLIMAASSFRSDEINKANRKISKLETDVEFLREVIVKLKNEHNDNK